MEPKRLTLANFNDFYPDDAACLDALFAERWAQGEPCPGCMRPTVLYRLKSRPAYSCKWCGWQLSILKGTIFHKSHVGLRDWFLAIYLFSASKQGMSAKELQRHLGHNYKTCWRMCRQVRLLFAEEPKGKLSGTVEADESWFGHEGKKVPVAGLLERGGDIRLKVVTDTDSSTLVPYVRKNVEEGSVLSTDQHLPYRRVTRHGYGHISVNHSKWQWADGEASTNGLENFWGLTKRAIRSTYVSVGEKYVSSYLAEFSWRRNHAGEAVFPLLLSRAARPSRLAP